MPTERVIIVGAGGHAKVVVDSLQAAGSRFEIWVATEDPKQTTQEILGYAVKTLRRELLEGGAWFHLAIGSGKVRERLDAQLSETGGRALTVMHPRASVSPHARIAEGSFVAAGAVVGPDALVGRSTIVNHGAIVDHDAIVGDYCHIAPGASLAGQIRLGRNVLVGAGARVLPGVNIGDNVTIGAGAVVTRDFESNQTLVGMPARRSE